MAITMPGYSESLKTPEVPGNWLEADGSVRLADIENPREGADLISSYVGIAKNKRSQISVQRSKPFQKWLRAMPRMAWQTPKAFEATRRRGVQGLRRSLERFKNGQKPIFEISSSNLDLRCARINF